MEMKFFFFSLPKIYVCRRLHLQKQVNQCCLLAVKACMC